MVKKLSPQQSPRAAHALTLLSSLIALTACGGGQGDTQALDAATATDSATDASTLEVTAAATKTGFFSMSFATGSSTTTTTVPKATTTAPKATTTTPATLSTAVLASLAKSSSINSGRVSKSLPSNTCGVADVGGWTVATPAKIDTTVALTHLKQPGSRIFYISSAKGSDSTGQMYFWNGTAIVDSTGSTKNSSGQAYGTDPNNPSAAVKPFKTWIYVSPRGNGADIGDSSIQLASHPSTRAGYPDWWLFARGETVDMKAQAAAFVKSKTPTATATTLATVDSNLTLSGGRSATEPQIIGAYGDTCLPRPRFVNSHSGTIYLNRRDGQPTLRNVLYQSIHIDGHGRNPAYSSYGLTMLGQTAESTNILFEDVWFDAAAITITGDNNAAVTFRRSLVTDAYSPDGTSHMQGIFYGGGGAGKLRIEESILLRNGFRGDPAQFAWPPTGTQTWNKFNRNMYISGTLNSMESGVFDSVSMLGTSGDQFRPGMRIERNFFYQGYLLMGAQGGKPDSAGATGTVLDNVMQSFNGTGTNENTGQPGWGLELAAGANAVAVKRNIFTGAQSQSNAAAVHIKPHSDCPYTYATRNNVVSQNIFDTGAAFSAIQTSDGVNYASACASPWVPRGVTGNSVTDNILLNSRNQQALYYPTVGAAGTTADTNYLNNKVYLNRSAAAAALGWKDPNRTLKTYLQGLGTTVASTDGFPEYLQAAQGMRRGTWRAELTAKPLVNHFRTGFGTDPLP